MKRRFRFPSDTRGNVLIMTVFGIFLLVAVAGASTDFGRWALVTLQAQQAIDAAALAAATLPNTATDTDRGNAVNRYFLMNYPANFMGVNITTGNISATFGATTKITINNVSMPTRLIRTVGVDTLRVSAANAIQTTNTTNGNNYDIMLVLDNSGSMASDDVGDVNSLESTLPAIALKSAVAYCKNSVIGKTDPAVCTNLTKDSTGLIGHSRLNALRYAATTFAANLLAKNSHSLVGAVNWSDKVIGSLHTTSDLATITGYLNRMYAFGGTNSYEGFQKAQELSAGFDPSHVHVVIYITDGINTIADSKSEHYVPPPPSAPPGTLGTVQDSSVPPCNSHDLCRKTNDLTLPLCTAFKDSGAQIYTIAFGKDINDGSVDANTAQTFMKACASTDASGNPNFYIAPDAQTLSDKFNAILSSIRKIKIMK